MKRARVKRAVTCTSRKRACTKAGALRDNTPGGRRLLRALHCHRPTRCGTPCAHTPAPQDTVSGMPMQMHMPLTPARQNPTVAVRSPSTAASTLMACSRAVAMSVVAPASSVSPPPARMAAEGGRARVPSTRSRRRPALIHPDLSCSSWHSGAQDRDVPVINRSGRAHGAGPSGDGMRGQFE